MPKQGGQGKGKPKLKDKDFGKALIRQQLQGAKSMKGLAVREKAKLSSVLENTSLEDFVNTAMMDGNGVEVMRVHQHDSFLVQPTVHQNLQTLSMQSIDYKHLRIPRKPAWTTTMSAEEVDRREKDAFLEWRREVATLELNDTTRKSTPFEKNIEVWRQLWRVLERSDIAIQIVDARNPMLYYSKDLTQYASEHSPPRPCLLLINKADLLTDFQRKEWTKYLHQQGICFAFYSARFEQEKLDHPTAAPTVSPPPTPSEGPTTNLTDDITSLTITPTTTTTANSNSKSFSALQEEEEEEELQQPNASNDKNTGTDKDAASTEEDEEDNVKSTSTAAAAAAAAAFIAKEPPAVTIDESRNTVVSAPPSAAPVDSATNSFSKVDLLDIIVDDLVEMFRTSFLTAPTTTTTTTTATTTATTTTTAVGGSNSAAGEVVWGDDINSKEPQDSDSEVEADEEEADGDEEEASDGDGDDDGSDEEGELGEGGEDYEYSEGEEEDIDEDDEVDDATASAPPHTPVPVSSTSFAATATATSPTTRSSYMQSEDWQNRRSRILNRQELELLLSRLPLKLGIHPQSKHSGKVCVGMVGYPNVGKSSVINTLLAVSSSTHGVVRVGVSSTPGKTKHFQTLIVSEGLMLCDCPGLVFPSFMQSTAEMICAGILPINQMRDYVQPMVVLTGRIPRHLLEATYGSKIVRHIDIKENPDRPPTPSEFLGAYCAVKGYITSGTGRWDEFRASKEILRDYVDGKLLFAMPPDLAGLDKGRWMRETESIVASRERVAGRLIRAQELHDSNESDSRGEMVFGGGKYNSSANTGGEGEEEGEEEDDDDVSEFPEDSVASNATSTTREHKRLKHWGKKNKKLRDKDPYGEENGVIAYVAHSRNRYPSLSNSTAAPMKVKRQNLLQSEEEPFVRAVLPHHALTLKGARTGAVG